MNQTEYLDSTIKLLRSKNEPELWLILPCDEAENVTGAPLFIFKSEKALREKFAEAVKKAGGHAIVAAWWLDD